jgi:hypothetical protein
MNSSTTHLSTVRGTSTAEFALCPLPFALCPSMIGHMISSREKGSTRFLSSERATGVSNVGRGASGLKAQGSPAPDANDITSSESERLLNLKRVRVTASPSSVSE